MRRITMAAMATVTTLVLLLSYRTSLGEGATTSEPAAPEGTGSSGTGNGTVVTPDEPDASAGSATGLHDGTFTGDAVSTRWGDVQVAITVSGGLITAADAVAYPTGNHHDQQINAYAVPVLNAEAVDAQSAEIDAVSGATVTSEGYIESLQSAIDSARA